IEDLGSSNGTFVNSPDQRATHAIPLTESDVVYFGSLAVPATRLLPMRTPHEPTGLPSPGTEPESLPAPVSVSPARAHQPGDLGTMLLLGQAPVIAILIVLATGRQAAAPITAASWSMGARGLAATCFALAVSAVWLGGSLGVWGSLGHGEGTPGAKRVHAFGWKRVVLCAAQCAVLLAIVHWGSSLKGDWLRMFGLMMMASVVGLLLGQVVCSLVRTPGIAVTVLV